MMGDNGGDGLEGAARLNELDFGANSKKTWESSTLPQDAAGKEGGDARCKDRFGRQDK